MQDDLKFVAGGSVGENDFRQFIPAQSPVGRDNGFAEKTFDFVEGRFSGPNQLPGQIIGIHNWHRTGSEGVRHGGFTHSHATRQTPDFHCPEAMAR
jgi:hypothetical protein